MDHPHNYGSSNSKRSYTEIADVGFDEPVLSNPDPSSLGYSQLPTSATGTFSQPHPAAAATAGDDCPQPQLQVPLPLPVQQKLDSICEEKKKQQPDAALRRRLGLLGEEKALKLLSEISAKKKIRTLSGYIGFLLREKYQCAPCSRSPSPSPSKSGPAASPLLHSRSSASQITPGRQELPKSQRRPCSASPSKSARTSLFQGPSSGLPISPVPQGLDDSLDAVRCTLLRMKPVPGIEECFNTIRREAQRKTTMLGGKESDSGPSMAMISKPSSGPSRSLRELEDAEKDKLRCTHCNGTRHTKETSFEIHGYPEWFLERRKQRGQGKPNRRAAEAKVADSGTGLAALISSGPSTSLQRVGLPEPKAQSQVGQQSSGLWKQNAGNNAGVSEANALGPSADFKQIVESKPDNLAQQLSLLNLRDNLT